MPIAIRPAVTADIPALNELIPTSARALSRGFYTPSETEAAIRYVFGVNLQLIEDGTYFVATEAGRILACGGWSYRATLYGGDQRPVGGGPVLDPAVDAARIRAFFVAPGQARKGLGSMLMQACAEAAGAAGFHRLELMSTLPGLPFYSKLGFRELRRVADTLPDGTTLALVQMDRALESERLSPR
jgi:GNAT superfamily N-acetyltransferase